MSDYRVTLNATVRAESLSEVNDDRLADALIALPEVIAVDGESPVEITPATPDIGRELCLLRSIKNDAGALARSVERGEVRFVPGTYPADMPSFDELVNALAGIEIEPVEPWTPENARRILADAGLLVDRQLTHIGGGIEAAELVLGGEARIWISESLADGIGWQACLYLDSEDEGYYLTGYEQYPRTAPQLLETVRALIAARNLAADIYETLFGADAGTGVILVLKGGGAVVGTLLNAVNARSVTVAQDGRQTRTLLLTDISAAQVIR